MILTSIGYAMRDKRSNNIIAKSRRLGDCSIIVPECEAVYEDIFMAIQKNIPRTIIHSDSQVVINAINGKIGAPKDVVNLVETIKKLFARFLESILEYYNRSTNSQF